MIEVYVQIGGTAVQWTLFQHLGDRERVVCQRLSNRMKSTVRALKNDRVLAEFLPHREECSEGC